MLGIGGEQVGLSLDFLAAARLARLFRLQHETVALVEVDALGRCCAVTRGLLDDALKNIVVGLRVARGVGRLDGKRRAKLSLRNIP